MSTIKTRYTLTQSQKMMIFVLSMSLYGLSNMFTELVPGIKLGPIELSIEYFAFIPLTLCMLFHPLYAAVGAAVGEVIFGELMLGQFGGLGSWRNSLPSHWRCIPQAAWYLIRRIVDRLEWLRLPAWRFTSF